MTKNLLKKTTLKEVAALAGVSLATVDRVVSERAPVSPHTKERVLSAIRELTEKKKDTTNDKSTFKKLSYGFIMESGEPFIESIESKICNLRDHYAEVNVALNIYSCDSPRFNTSELLDVLKRASADNDGLIVLARELPSICSAVNQVIAKGMPVVCFTSDLSDTSRLGYVGMNNVNAGRTAGNLMGNYIGNQEGEVVLIVSAPFRSQYERELGFRRVIRESFPSLKIRESLNNHDLDEDSYKSLMALFESGVKPLGVYCMTGGTKGIADAIKEMGWTKDIVFITHELNKSSYSLLSEYEIDIVIDQDIHSSIVNAINALSYHYKAVQTQVKFAPQAPLIITPENLDVHANTLLPTLIDKAAIADYRQGDNGTDEYSQP